MRRRQLARLALAGLVAAAAPYARADTDLGPIDVSGSLEAGARGIAGEGTHSAKFEEYRDPQEIPFGAADLSLRDLEGRYHLHFGGFDMGERDADYFVDGGRWGLWGVSGSISLLPHNFSNQALTPYFGVGSGSLVLPFAPPVDTPSFEAAVTGAAHDAELGFQTDESKISAYFKPSEDSELRAGYREIDRDGRRPDQITFGFSNFVHFPRPVNESVREGSADFLLSKDTWSLALNYTASYFQNDLRSIQVANPASFAGGSALGAIAAEPDNQSHMLSATGSLLLPTSFPTHVAATVAYGIRRQEEAFPAMTVNPLLISPALPAHDLGGDVRPLLVNFLLTSRVTPALEVIGRYRLYDYDNRTNEILFTQTSTTDATVDTENRRSYAPSFLTENAKLETAYHITERAKASVGFAWEHWDRGIEREVRHSDEWSPQAAFDYRAGNWGRFRADYEFHDRNAHGYNELAPFFALEPGQPQSPLTPPIRKYDEAGNLRHDFKLLSQFYVHESFDVTFTGDYHRTHWTEGDFGLLHDDEFALSIDATWRPHPRVEINAYYTFDWMALLQTSASSSGTLPWRGQSEDTGNTGGIDTAVAILPQQLTFTAGFFIHQGNGRTMANGAPADAVDYPEIGDTLWAATTSLEYKYDAHWTLVGRYRYEHWDHGDFQFDEIGVTRLTSAVEGVPLLGTNNDVFLHNGLEDYDVHLFSLSVVYHF